MITAERLASEEARKDPWCLKITEKVSIKIASEASYLYDLTGQNFIKNAKNGHFGGQTVLPERSILIG